MMKFGRALLAALVLLVPVTALAQNNFATPGGSTAAGAIAMCLNGSNQAVPCSAVVPLQIAGTFSATLGGFAPAGTFATLTATASSASVALPAGAVVIFQNTGTTAVSCTLGVGSATATASQNIVQPASWLALTVGSNTFGACIDVTGSTSNLVVLSGGAGLPTGAGGGGGSGGGGAITAASGSYASGALSSGSVASGAFASGSVASGAMVDLGAIADAAATAGSTGTISAKLRLATTQLATINTTLGSPLQAGGSIGNTTFAVTNAGTFAVQAPITSWGGGTLGAMANYGTSPGAVLAPGVNAFVTNSNTNIGNNADTIAAAALSVSPVGNFGFVYNGTTWDRMRSGTQTGSVAVASADPCLGANKTNLPISQNGTSSVQLIGLSGSTVIYVCSLSLIAAGATTVALTTGTGTACVTGNAAVIGTTTASIANSISLAANGGLTLGNGAGTIAKGAASSELCMILGTSVFVAGNLTYVQQ